MSIILTLTITGAGDVITLSHTHKPAEQPARGSLELTAEDLWRLATTHTLQQVADLLRSYVETGKPKSFCYGYTSRSMCRIASKGLEHVRTERDSRTWIDAKYGPVLHRYMFKRGRERLCDAREERARAKRRTRELK